MFDNHFEVFLADTQESRNIHYSIRYNVYCEEMGFENKDDFPMEMEYDEHDEYSTHFIVRHRHTGQWVGAMRLIYRKSRPLPVEQYCTLHEPIHSSAHQHSVELSRLCVIKEIRRRYSGNEGPEIQESDKIRLLHNDQRTNRQIIWGLLNAATEYCYSNKIPNWYFLTTNSLAKVLRKGGFDMSRIGEPCNHKGERYPFKKDVVDTYLNESWRDNFKVGYRKFSKLNLPESLESLDVMAA